MGQRLGDASSIYVPALVVGEEPDFWSGHAGRDKLQQELVHASAVKVVVIPNATHYVHLDRPEHGPKTVAR